MLGKELGDMEGRTKREKVRDIRKNQRTKGYLRIENQGAEVGSEGCERT